MPSKLWKSWHDQTKLGEPPLVQLKLHCVCAGSAMLRPSSWDPDWDLEPSSGPTARAGHALC
jgi:hypothetical protein